MTRIRRAARRLALAALMLAAATHRRTRTRRRSAISTSCSATAASTARWSSTSSTPRTSSGSARRSGCSRTRSRNETRERLGALLKPRLLLRGDRRLDLQWTSLEVLRDDAALRLKYRIPNENPGALALDANLFPYDPLHQTFINIYEDGALKQQLIFNADSKEYVYYAGTTQGALAVMRTFTAVGHPSHPDRTRPHPVPRRAAAARRPLDGAAEDRLRSSPSATASRCRWRRSTWSRRRRASSSRRSP